MSGRALYLQNYQAANASAKQAQVQIPPDSLPLTELAQLLEQVLLSPLSSYPHPAVAVMFFELFAKHSDFLKCRPQHIGPLLSALTDTRGLQQPKPHVKRRIYYLTYRIIKDVLNSIPSEFISGLIQAFKPSLQINVQLPPLEDSQDDLLTVATGETSFFNDQLHLYETCGILIASLSNDHPTLVRLLEDIAAPLLSDLQLQLNSVAQDKNPMILIRIHHLIMALGTLVKSLPETGSTEPPWLSLLLQINKSVLVTLERLSAYKIIRDAV